jgi:hypothetical protein
MSQLRVYVCGAYSGPDVITIQGNIRRGLRLSIEVLQAGMAPFSPWNDWTFGVIADIPLTTFYSYSMAWLEAAEAVLVVPVRAEKSKGTQAEIARAKELNIPVFYTLSELKEWHAKQKIGTIPALDLNGPPANDETAKAVHPCLRA